jgi:hypothetical protein
VRSRLPRPARDGSETGLPRLAASPQGSNRRSARGTGSEGSIRGQAAAGRWECPRARPPAPDRGTGSATARTRAAWRPRARGSPKLCRLCQCVSEMLRRRIVRVGREQQHDQQHVAATESTHDQEERRIGPAAAGGGELVRRGGHTERIPDWDSLRGLRRTAAARSLTSLRSWHDGRIRTSMLLYSPHSKGLRSGVAESTQRSPRNAATV